MEIETMELRINKKSYYKKNFFGKYKLVDVNNVIEYWDEDHWSLLPLNKEDVYYE